MEEQPEHYHRPYIGIYRGRAYYTFRLCIKILETMMLCHKLEHGTGLTGALYMAHSTRARQRNSWTVCPV